MIWLTEAAASKLTLVYNNMKTNRVPNWPLRLKVEMWLIASVTRLGDLLEFGPLFKALGNN